MMDRRRWLDSGEASPEALALLREARGSAPLDAATRARSRRRLAAVTGVAAGSSVLLFLQHLAFGAIVGVSALAVAGATGVIDVPKRAEAPKAVGAPAQRSPSMLGKQAHQAPLAPARALETPPAPPVAEREPGVHAPEPVRSNAARARDASLPVQAAPSASTRNGAADLAREARLLDRARSLAQSEPAAALAELSRHEKEFGFGALRLEREFLKVTALVRQGRRAEAREHARRLRELAPGSLYEERLRALLAEQP